MGLCVALETELGESIAMIPDDQNALHRLLPVPGSSDEMLAAVDWYGDTVFNHYQMKRFLAEWNNLTAKAATPGEQRLLDEIEALAVRCQESGDLYLKFIGD